MKGNEDIWMPLFLEPFLTESDVLGFCLAQARQQNILEAVIQSAAGAADLHGGCASNRHAHGLNLEIHVVRGSCASGQLIDKFLDSA